MRENGGHRVGQLAPRPEESDPVKLRARIRSLEESLHESQKRATAMERAHRTVHLQYMMAVGHMDDATKAEHIREIHAIPSGECISCAKAISAEQDDGDEAGAQATATAPVAAVPASSGATRSNPQRPAKRRQR